MADFYTMCHLLFCWSKSKMKVLMIGDVVARPGRRAVLEMVEKLREIHKIDIVIMNAENVAGGFSITPK